MVVSKVVVNEILLIGSVIESTSTRTNLVTGEDAEVLVPIANVISWLQDLQRVLWRDGDAYRPISLLLGKWNFVQTKLVPLAMGCHHDWRLALTLCKILVLLTKPMGEEAKRAGRLVVDVRSGNVDEV